MSPFGFYGGILFYAVPQLLAARHIPEERIASLTGLLILPGVLSFLVAPILDVRFSRRWYATVCCALATAALAVGLFAAALGGWLASVIPSDRRPTLRSLGSARLPERKHGHGYKYRLRDKGASHVNSLQSE